MTDVDVLTVAEAAKLLRVHKDTLYDAVGANRIPHLRLGRQIRFSRAVLIKALEEGRVSRGKAMR